MRTTWTSADCRSAFTVIGSTFEQCDFSELRSEAIPPSVAALGDTCPAATQVTIDTAAGTMRADQIVKLGAGRFVNFESKVNTSRPTASQLAKWKELAANGGRGRGARAISTQLEGNVDRMPTIVVKLSSTYEIVGADLAAGTLEEFPWAANLLDHLNGVVPVAP